MIGMHFVKDGTLNLEDSKLMKRLFMMRQSGDYDDMFDWSEEDVLPIIEPTRQLVAKIKSLL